MSYHKIMARVSSIIRRAVVGRVDSSNPGQTLQVQTYADEEDDEVEHMEPYGFTSNPPVGSEGLALSLAGDVGAAVVINVGNRQTRVVSLDSGEVAVYHRGGARLQMNNDGSIDVFPAAGQTVNLGGEGGLAVARQTDPISLNEATITILTNALAAIPFPIPPTPGLWAGTITQGGQGSNST